jgi:hypothetical protein
MAPLDSELGTASGEYHGTWMHFAHGSSRRAAVAAQKCGQTDIEVVKLSDPFVLRSRATVHNLKAAHPGRCCPYLLQ